ncbi:unnamed protein product, partial [Didymodactylos carnosus]
LMVVDQDRDIKLGRAKSISLEYALEIASSTQ